MESLYVKSRNAEYYVKRLLETMGYRWILRSDASHTPIDLLASDGNVIIAVQCKVRGYLNQEDRKMLVEWAERSKAKPMLAGKKGGRWRLDALPYPASDTTPRVIINQSRR